MYISQISTKTSTGKISHICILLRESYRDPVTKKVRTRTLANLTHCNPGEIEAMKIALKHKNDLTVLKSGKKSIKLKQGKSVGGVWMLAEIARRLGIEQALTTDRQGKLALFQILARIIDQGSRLSAVRQAQMYASTDILCIRQGFNEETLYKNLSWLSKNQSEIEKRLFKARYKNKKPELFLYDVTSSYMEGKCNELSDWGYNRDKKNGKMQVVVGLLCDDEGAPESVEVFKGNTKDTGTFASQVKKSAKEYGCERVTFVGDRGMIKSGQIATLKSEDYCYITAITKPQIKKLIRKGMFQLELFSTELCEIEDNDGKRYILRHNPIRTQEIAKTRQDKAAKIENLLNKKNVYLAEHKKAKVSTAINEIKKYVKRLKLDAWLKVVSEKRILKLKEDKQALQKESELDGCYVIISDLPNDVSKETIHDRYKSLAEVEYAFRTMKTVMLEMRPWFVCSEESTRGHALIVMLAYLIVRYLRKSWTDLELTVEEGLEHLKLICSNELVIDGKYACHQIPDPSDISEKLLNAVNVKLPNVLPSIGAKIVSRKKLCPQRKNSC